MENCCIVSIKILYLFFAACSDGRVDVPKITQSFKRLSVATTLTFIRAIF